MENKLNVCKNHGYCCTEIPKEKSTSNGGKWRKIYESPIEAGIESLLEKLDTCHNNLEKSSTNKKNNHTPSGYSLFTHCSFDVTKNKLNYYRGKDSMKKFCKDLRQHATKVINYGKKKEMMSLTIEENKSYHEHDIFLSCKKEFSTNDDNKKYHKVRDNCHYTGNIEELLIIFVI